MNQHYLPRFYLQHFADAQGRIQVYDLQRKRWYQSTPNKVARERDFYTQTSRDGAKDDQVDEVLREIEGRVAPTVQKAVKGDPLSGVDIVHLCVFLTTQMSRIPTRLELIANFTTEIAERGAWLRYQHMREHPEDLPSYLKELREDAGLTIPENFSIEDLNPSKYKISTNVASCAGLAIASTFELGPLIQQMMEFTLLEAPADDVFISSDHPFFMVVPGHRGPAGLAHEGVEATLPLSQKVCLVLKNGPRKGEVVRRRTTSVGVETINLRTAAIANRLLAAPNRDFPGSHLFVDGGRQLEVQPDAITESEPPPADETSPR